MALHKALKQAVKWSLVLRNVAEAVTPPRPTKREIKPLTQQQLRALLETALNDQLYALWVLACTTGMRNGELWAVQWRDIDLDAGTLQVNRSAWRNCLENRNTRRIGVPKAAKRGRSGPNRPLPGADEALSRGHRLFSKQFRKGFSQKFEGRRAQRRRLLDASSLEGQSHRPVLLLVCP